MKSKSWNSIGRWIIYGLLLVVFVGPYWGIIATAFSGAPVKPVSCWPGPISSRGITLSSPGWILASGNTC